MIVDRPSSHFIFVLSQDHIYRRYNYINLNGKPLTNKEYLESWGKWLIFGQVEELADLAKRIDPFVEAKQVPAVKYDRKEIEEFGLDRCVMCVYCHMEQRDGVWAILESLGVTSKAWAYERETLERWMPGGANLERWIEGRGLSAERADVVRRQAEAQFKHLFGNDNAIFTGIEQ